MRINKGFPQKVLLTMLSLVLSLGIVLMSMPMETWAAYGKSTVIDGVREAETVNNPNDSADQEPKTGISDYPQFYATIAIIAGLLYIMISFLEKHGLTEAEKDAFISRIVKWAKRGRRYRRFIAKAVVFIFLVFYHSIGRQSMIELDKAHKR